MQDIEKENNGFWLWLFAAWFIAVVATGGSLFFSEVMTYQPCVLCWYQRIGMYPLVLLLLIGLIKNDRQVLRYAFPLTAVGWFFAAYHNLLHLGIIPESASPCIVGVPCSTIYIQWMGFITIPLLSIVAFSLILAIYAHLFRRYIRS